MFVLVDKKSGDPVTEGNALENIKGYASIKSVTGIELEVPWFIDPLVPEGFDHAVQAAPLGELINNPLVVSCIVNKGV